MSWRGLGSAGPDGDPKAREGIARPNTERRIHTLPCARRWCTGASTRESGIMLCTMRNPLVAVGAGDHCLPKLYRQPYMLACLVATQITLCVASPFEVFNTQAPAALLKEQELVPTCVQRLALRLGSVRIGSVVCWNQVWFAYFETFRFQG